MADILTLLSRTPATIATLLEDLPESLLHCDEGPDTFSPFSVLGHLVQAEHTNWLPRARWILAHGWEKPFPPFDRFAHIKRYEDAALAELLEEFARLRAEGVAAARTLIAEGADMNAGGLHPELGNVTLGELLATWAVHDLSHISQIVRTVAHQFDAAVGPWKEYLSILSDR